MQDSDAAAFSQDSALLIPFQQVKAGETPGNEDHGCDRDKCNGEVESTPPKEVLQILGMCPVDFR